MPFAFHLQAIRLGGDEPWLRLNPKRQQHRTRKPLIESDRVKGTTVYDPRGNDIGSIKRLMIDKVSGRVAYAVMTFGGFLGIGADEHAIPWGKLTYDTNLRGYRTDITIDQLQRAPAFSRDPEHDWSDRKREQELHDHYRTPYYWGSKSKRCGEVGGEPTKNYGSWRTSALRRREPAVSPARETRRA
jgi:PRC-barrel domain